jgi:hypothetical protein
MDSTLDNAIREAAARVRVETEGKLQLLRDAHRIVGDLLLRLVHQGAFEASSPTEDQSQRLSLTAGLIQSVSVSNDLIVSGFYLERRCRASPTNGSCGEGSRNSQGKI